MKGYPPGRKKAEPLVNLVCPICGSRFQRPPNQIARAKVNYCSRPCRWASMRALRLASGNPMFKGAEASPASQRRRARHRYELPPLCERCKKVPPVDRHHRNGDTNDNRPENIAFLCRRCHMVEDGRLAALPTRKPAPPRPPNRTCGRCGKAFYRTPSQIRAGRDKYCSRACFNATPKRGRKLTREQVVAIRAELRALERPNGKRPPGSLVQLAARYGVSTSLLREIARGRRWANA